MIEWLPTVLKGIGDSKLAAILREQVSLLELQRDQAIGERDVLATKLAQAKAQIELLESDNAQFKAELDDSQRKAEDDLVPHKGALWKRKPGGGYFDDVLCRECHNPMVSSQGVLSYVCVPCGVRVNFTGRQLAQVMSDLP
jgi:hypothetical protein